MTLPASMMLAEKYTALCDIKYFEGLNRCFVHCMSQSVNSKYIPRDGFFGIQILQISILAWVHPGPSWGAHDGKITRKLQSLV